MSVFPHKDNEVSWQRDFAVSTTKILKCIKKIILFYLLVIVCCDVGVTAHQPSAKLRQQDGVRKLDRNEGILSEIVLKFYSLKN